MSYLQRLHDLGFDKARNIPFTKEYRIGCTQCEALVINGVPYHEHGCPNERRELSCKWCGTKFIEQGFDQSGCCSHSCWTAHSGHDCDCEECYIPEDDE
jgi:hypothetical protein